MLSGIIVNSIILLLLLLFAVSYIYINNKTHFFLRHILSEKDFGFKQYQKKITWMKFINLSSFIILILFVSYSIVSSILFYVSIEFKSKKNGEFEISDREFDKKFYTKPSRGVPGFNQALWVILNYPDEKGMNDYENLEEGDGEISGEVLLNGKPLSLRKLTLIFNEGLYGKECVETDNVGKFKIKVPFGDYSFNAFEIYGSDIFKKVSLQNAYIFFKKSDIKEITFSLTKQKNYFKLPTVEIVDPVKNITLYFTKYSLSELADDSKIFQWESVRSAKKFHFEITRVVKKEVNGNNVTSFHPYIKNLDFFTKQNYINFREFKDMCKYFEPGVYGIKVYAFNHQNKLISYSKYYTQLAFIDKNEEEKGK